MAPIAGQRLLVAAPLPALSGLPFVAASRSFAIAIAISRAQKTQSHLVEHGRVFHLVKSEVEKRGELGGFVRVETVTTSTPLGMSLFSMHPVR